MMSRKKLCIVIGVLVVIAAVAALMVYKQPPSSLPKVSTQKQYSSTNVSRTTAPITTPQNTHIHFELNPGNPISCGLTCRQTTATLTNAGDETAHNVKVILNIYSNTGNNIYSTQKSIGDLAGGQSITKTETINLDCGYFDIKCIGHLPFTLRTEIIFDEGTQTFPDQQFSG